MASLPILFHTHIHGVDPTFIRLSQCSSTPIGLGVVDPLHLPKSYGHVPSHVILDTLDFPPSSFLFFFISKTFAITESDGIPHVFQNLPEGGTTILSLDLQRCPKADKIVAFEKEENTVLDVRSRPKLRDGEVILPHLIGHLPWCKTQNSTGFGFHPSTLP